MEDPDSNPVVTTFVNTLIYILCRVVVQHEIGSAVFSRNRVDMSTLPLKVQETIRLIDAALSQTLSVKDNIDLCFLKKDLELPGRVNTLFTHTALSMFRHNKNLPIPGEHVAVLKANQLFPKPQKEYFIKENTLGRFLEILRLLKQFTSNTTIVAPTAEQFHQWTKIVFEDGSKEIIKAFIIAFLNPSDGKSFVKFIHKFNLGINVYSEHSVLLQLCWRNIFDRELFDALHREGSVYTGSEQIICMLGIGQGRNFSATDLACGHGNLALLNWLLEHGQKLNPSAVDWAIDCKQLEMCELLTKQYGFELTAEQSLKLSEIRSAMPACKK